MSLEKNIMTKMKEAMKAKDSVALESLRAIKSAILLAKTETGSSDGLSEEQEVKMLQKLMKRQRNMDLIMIIFLNTLKTTLLNMVKKPVSILSLEIIDKQS